MFASTGGLAETGRVPSWSDGSVDASPRTEPEVGSLPPSGAFTMLPPPLLWSPPVQATRKVGKRGVTKVVQPDHFEPDQHYYARVLNAQVHPLVASFMQMGNERIIARYLHLNPSVDARALRQILNNHCHHFRWAGSDLFSVTTTQARRQMICIETNSCPSGQKSMPWPNNQADRAGYRLVLEQGFSESIRALDKTMGALAVIYDKNVMEASGYAAAMADLFNEPVYLTEFYDTDIDPPARWQDGLLYIRTSTEDWVPIRAAFRYVTQRPWHRIPVMTHTVIFNSIIACLAGGRNKGMAAKAYEMLNGQLERTNLAIRTPATRYDVPLGAVRGMVEAMGGHAVIKVPYANAGQGVFTITRPAEMDEFMAFAHQYDNLIVQSLVGNQTWSSATTDGTFYHVGTVPDHRLRTYVADLRMMVCSTPNGFVPVAMYARRSRQPLQARPDENPNVTTWDMLGTNLSVKDEQGNWTTETNRLLLMDCKDFNQLGLGLDDLIDAYIQTVLSVVAIDNMCQRLMPKGVFDTQAFAQLNPDPALLRELS